MRDIITAFDKYLAEQELTFNAIVIGGAAMILLKVTSRATRDVDCLDPEIPEAVKNASVQFAHHYARQFGLADDWLNNGPASLKLELPEGWHDRVRPLYTGQALNLFTLGRMDLLSSKLYAYCDRQQDLADCLALNPQPHELDQCLPWILQRDANPLWPNHVRVSVNQLKEMLSHEHGSE